MSNRTTLKRYVGAATVSTLLLVGPVTAQNDEIADICDNALVVAMDNLITLLAVIGPVVGAVVAMIAMLVLTTTQNPRKKRKWIDTRNDAIKYGVGILFIGAIMNLLVSVVGPEDVATCINVVGI